MDLPDFDRLWNYNDPAGTERAFDAVLEPARASGNVPYLAELLTQMARAQGLQRRVAEAHRTLDEAETLAANAGDRVRVRYLLERGRVFNSSQQRDEARALFLAAFQLAQATGEDFLAVDAAHMVAIAAPPDEQLEWNLRAVELAAGSADARAQGWLGSLYNNLGWTYHELGRFEDALATFQKGLEWQTAAGKLAETRIAAWTVARALRSLGRYEDALAMQRQNLEDIRAAREEDGYTHEELGECLLALGREEEARACFARAYTVLAEDAWLREGEPVRLKRLARLGGVQES